MDTQTIIDLPFDALKEGFTYFICALWVILGVQNGADKAPWWVILVGPLFFLVVIGVFAGPLVGTKVYLVLAVLFAMGYGFGRHLRFNRDTNQPQ